MASIKVKFRPSTVTSCEGSIYYQIIHEREVRQLLTDYKLFQDEWDKSHSVIKTNHKGERKSFILSIRERIRCEVDRLAKIDRKLNSKNLSYTTDDIINEFNHYSTEYSLFRFMENLIALFKLNGKIRTSETYKSALNSFKKYRKNKIIFLLVRDACYCYSDVF